MRGITPDYRDYTKQRYSTQSTAALPGGGGGGGLSGNCSGSNPLFRPVLSSPAHGSSSLIAMAQIDLGSVFTTWVQLASWNRISTELSGKGIYKN
jgi:hypothetical protein